MPRRKNVFEYSQDVGQNLLTAIREQFELKDEFINEFQQSPMILLRFSAGANWWYNHGYIFFKHFAVLMYWYVDESRTGNLPTRPDYTAFAGDPDLVLMFNRNWDQPVYRSFELEDFEYLIYHEDETTAFEELEKYVNSVYFDRKTNSWHGLSAIDSSHFMNPEEKLSNPNPNIKWDRLLDYPDDGGTYNYENLFKFWLEMKVRFEGFESQAWQVVLSPPTSMPEMEDSEIDLPLDHSENMEEVEISTSEGSQVVEIDQRWLAMIRGWSRTRLIEELNRKSIRYNSAMTNDELIQRLIEWKYDSGQFEDQISIDVDAISNQRMDAIRLLVKLGYLGNYPENEIFDKKSILYDLRSKLESDPPLICSAWERFPGFHMEFYAGNSYFVPDRYSIDADATLVYSTHFNVSDMLIIRRAVRDTYQENARRALGILESVVRIGISLGFSTAAGYLAGKMVVVPELLGTYAMSNGSLVDMYWNEKKLIPNFGAVSILAGAGAGTGANLLVDFEIEANDRKWYEYPMQLCAAYGKATDYMNNPVSHAGKYFSVRQESTAEHMGFTHVIGPLWNEMLELQVDQNKYANLGNQFFGGKIEVVPFDGQMPYQKSDIFAGHKWLVAMMGIEVALGNRAWEVRNF